jgi:hypothetical protein
LNTTNIVPPQGKIVEHIPGTLSVIGVPRRDHGGKSFFNFQQVRTNVLQDSEQFVELVWVP